MTAQQHSISLQSDLASVRQARWFARDVVVEWGLARLADEVQLGVSELVTNAVRHAGTGVVVTLRLDTDLLVEVRDDAAGSAPVAPAVPAALTATSGRGLHIVSAISSEWGVRGDADGKTVWFRLALPSGDTSDADVLSMRGHRAPDAPAARKHGRGAADTSAAHQLEARAAN